MDILVGFVVWLVVMSIFSFLIYKIKTKNKPNYKNEKYTETKITPTKPLPDKINRQK